VTAISAGKRRAEHIDHILQAQSITHSAMDLTKHAVHHHIILIAALTSTLW
jgi:hypothetical protein